MLSCLVISGFGLNSAFALNVNSAKQPKLCSGNTAKVNQAKPKQVILLIGDSLSMGYGLAHQQDWVALLNLKLGHDCLPYRVVNASISGDTTASGLARLPQLLTENNPVIAIIELGGNDGLRGLNLEHTAANIGKMVQLAKGSGVKVLLIGIEIPPNYGPHYLLGFKAIYSKLAKQQKVNFLPFLLKGVAGNKKLMQKDGIHPNLKAQVIIFNSVWAKLLPLLTQE